MASDQRRRAICKHLVRLLREERERQNLSLNGLAERAGLSRQTVSFIEQEERNPTVDTLLRITEVLDIELDELMRKARRFADELKPR